MAEATVAPAVQADTHHLIESPVAANQATVDLPFPEGFIGTFAEDGSVVVTTERLPFTVTEVTTQDQLFKAVALRYEAYARHLPELAAHLRGPEPQDTQPGYTVLLAESRLDGSALATVRLQTNDAGPLGMESSFPLPSWMRGRRLAEATRLAVSRATHGRFITTVMFKAYFQFCLARDIDWMAICARSPLDRIYLSLQFEDIVAGGEYLPLHHSGDIPHRALAFNVRTAEPRWRAGKHPLYAFMGLTHHPDLQVGLPGPSAVPKTVYYRDRAPAA